MIQVGQTIGNYKVTSKLGEGGMGIVYLAEHPVIGRKVAMKAIHPELSRNAEVVSRFMTEAKSVNQIGNEHIVDISDFGNTADGEFYFIMEYLQGEALADRLKRERLLQPTRALQMAAQVADALAASHGHGIIHRDLKPENIFLITRGNNPDFVKVLDFGLAKLTQGEEKVTHKTRTGSVMGTPFYMAPEQCEGKASIDHRADVYSLGVILFEMLTGTVPFTGEGYGEIIVKHITQPAPSARALNPALSAAHEAILMRALAKSRDDRFATMLDFRTAMLDPERYLSGQSEIGMSGTMMSVSPSAIADAANSARIMLGNTQPAAGRTALPMNVPTPAPVPRLPTAFEHAGAISQADLKVKRSSKAGWVIGGVGALAVLGGAATLALKVRATEAPPVPSPATARPVAAAPAPPPAAPPAPAQIVLTMESTPPGANVYRGGEEQPLGTTPFTLEVVKGSDLRLVFKRPGFLDYTASVRADEAKKVHAPLSAAATDEPARPVAKAEPVEPKKPRMRSAKRPSTPEAPAPLTDGDSVLKPSF